MSKKKMRVAFRKRAPGFYSRAIKIWTGGPYSHCELVFPDGRCFSSDERDGGTRFKRIDLRGDEWDIVDVPVNSFYIDALDKFCHDEDKCKYDWRGISFSFLPIPIGWQHPDKWFCSEIVAAALQIAGWLRGYTPASLSPNGLYKALTKEVNRAESGT